MIDRNSAAPKRKFDVQVGHLRVTVQGLDRQEAIENARNRLCRDMPRMWDVIRGLAESQFNVTHCGEN